jgi:hypothetical protein
MDEGKQNDHETSRVNPTKPTLREWGWVSPAVPLIAGAMLVVFGLVVLDGGGQTLGVGMLTVGGAFLAIGIIAYGVRLGTMSAHEQLDKMEYRERLAEYNEVQKSRDAQVSSEGDH